MKKNLTYIVTILACLAIGATSCYWLMSFENSKDRQELIDKLSECSKVRQYLSDELDRYPVQCPNCVYNLRHEWPEPYEGPDPSLKPLFDFDGELDRRFRFIADFDGDGLEDMALSCGSYTFGTGGGCFELFLQITNGVYREVGGFGSYASLGSIAIEHINEYSCNARIWTYGRAGGGMYLITAQEIKNQKYDECGRIWTYGDDCWGGEIKNLVFNNPAKAPIRLEYSNSTNALGEAVWVLLDSYTPPNGESENPPAAEEE